MESRGLSRGVAEAIGHNLSAACESGFCFVHTETEVKKLPDWIARYWVEWLFGIVAAMMVAGYQRVSKHMRHAQKKDRALDDGMRALLRDRIISACDHYFEKGYAPVYARENITSMYDAYHSLGGDGIVTDMVKQAMELPYKKGGEAPVEQSRESRAAINTSRRNEV